MKRMEERYLWSSPSLELLRGVIRPSYGLTVGASPRRALAEGFLPCLPEREGSGVARKFLLQAHCSHAAKIFDTIEKVRFLDGLKLFI
jgi:hypothetical protein